MNPLIYDPRLVGISFYPSSWLTYCWWKKSCTTFKGLHLKARAPNFYIACKHNDENGFVRLTEIPHHLSKCHPTLSLGVRGCKLCIGKCKIIEVVQDFFHPPKKGKKFFYFGFAKFFPPPTASRGSNPSSIRIGASHSSPSVLHSSLAGSWARGKMSYMAAAAHYTANYTQHSHYITRNTTRYTTPNTTEMLPGAACRVRTEKLACMFILLLKGFKAPKCCPCQQFGSVACSVACNVACSVVCSVAWSCHATPVTFTSFLEGDSASSLLLVRQPVSGMPALLCPACVAIMVKSKCVRFHAL